MVPCIESDDNFKLIVLVNTLAGGVGGLGLWVGILIPGIKSSAA